MADRVVENYTSEVPPMPEVLQRLLVVALDEGRERIAAGEDLVPFTMLVVGDSLFTEAADGATTDECYRIARHTVEGARGALAYAFCYDGYLDTDEGVKDCVIAEGGVPGTPEGFAMGYLYGTVGGAVRFNDDPSFIGSAPNFMEGLVEEVAADEGDEASDEGADEADEADGADESADADADDADAAADEA